MRLLHAGAVAGWPRAADLFLFSRLPLALPSLNPVLGTVDLLLAFHPAASASASCWCLDVLTCPGRRIFFLALLVAYQPRFGGLFELGS